jgi:hypothetical protein
MFLRRALGRLRQHSWFAVLVDLIVVIAGILIALEVDAWAQARDDRRLERVYLQRLKEDLQIERAGMDAAERYAQERIGAARLLGRLLEDPTFAAKEPARVPWALETATWRTFPQINAFVYRELQSTGRFVLIRAEPLRRNLTEHYTTLQIDARVGDDLLAEQRFDAAVAGLLDIDELEAIEKVEGDHAKIAMAPERALALARALAERPPAIAELPSLVQHHTFNLRVIRQMRDRADAIIRQIDVLLSGVAVESEER